MGRNCVGRNQEELIVIDRAIDSIRHGRLALLRDSRGSMVVEFALLVPILLGMLFGITEFGVAMYNKIELTDATRIAARELSIGRSNATVWTDTRARFFASAPGVPAGNVTLSLSVNGTACASNSACQTLLGTSIGAPAAVSASLPCRLFTTYNILPGCTLVSSTAARVE